MTVYDARHLAAYGLILVAIATLSYRYIEFGAEKDWRKLFRPA